MLKYSVSKNLKGSHKNSFKAKPNVYCFGKGTTYGFTAVEHNDLTRLATDALYYAISPYLYTPEGHRDRNKVVGVGTVLIIDIDAKTDIRQELFTSLASIPYQYITVPTQNHLTESNGAYSFKYRLLVPMQGVITKEQYKASIHWLVHTYNIPNVDSASWTDARFFAPTIPLVGSQYSKEDASDPQSKPFVVTQEIQDEFLQRVQLNGGQLHPEVYPQRLTGTVLSYVEEMDKYQIPSDEVEDSASKLSGRVLTIPYESTDNTISKSAFKRINTGVEIPFGEVAVALQPNQRVFCRCPNEHQHTDPSDIRYAWLLKTGAGEVRLYCSSDTCKSQVGDYQRITLPDWETFVSPKNYSRTISRTETLVSTITYKLLTLMAEDICKLDNVTVDDWHEKIAYAKNAMFDRIIDENALYILCLLTCRLASGLPYVYDISLAGGVVGVLQVKDAPKLNGGNWYSHLFKKGFSELYKMAKDKKSFNKGAVFKDILQSISVDTGYTTVVYETTDLQPSKLYNGAIQVDVNLVGREVTIINNSFDEPVYRKKKELEKLGVHQYPQYNQVVGAFVGHWRLPYGEVMFGKTPINDVTTLLILFAGLNMYTDGVANQRHTTFVITAPSGVGKTSLLKNIAEVGLSNDDSHSANLFGHKDLYPQSIDNCKNKLWTTGDELSPALMREMRVPALLTNLTRKLVRVNVKGKVDSEFTSFTKVMWGARAWEAISGIPQATELRNRLFAITYLDEMFEIDGRIQTPFLSLCNSDAGSVDFIVQHWIASRYIEIKNMILSMSIENRLKAFSMFREALKAKYAGTIEYKVEYDEDDDTKIQIKATEVLSDKMRGALVVLQALVDYQRKIVRGGGDKIAGQGIVFSPITGAKARVNSLGALSKRIYKAEEITWKLYEQGHDCIAIPLVSSHTYEWLKLLVTFTYGDTKRAFAVSNSMDTGAFKKLLADLKPLDSYKNRDTRTTPCGVDDVKGLGFYVVKIADIENFILKH